MPVVRATQATHNMLDIPACKQHIKGTVSTTVLLTLLAIWGRATWGHQIWGRAKWGHQIWGRATWVTNMVTGNKSLKTNVNFCSVTVQ